MLLQMVLQPEYFHPAKIQITIHTAGMEPMKYCKLIGWKNPFKNLLCKSYQITNLMCIELSYAVYIDHFATFKKWLDQFLECIDCIRCCKDERCKIWHQCGQKTFNGVNVGIWAYKVENVSSKAVGDITSISFR